MGSLILTVLPPAMGVALSPLTIVAVIVVVLSRRPLGNGLAFLTGWAVAIAVGVTAAYAVTGALSAHEQRDPPTWVPVLRLILGSVLVISAWWVWRQGRRPVRAMAAAGNPAELTAAAPQLPGWLQAVESFTPARSAAIPQPSACSTRSTCHSSSSSGSTSGSRTSERERPWRRSRWSSSSR